MKNNIFLFLVASLLPSMLFAAECRYTRQQLTKMESDHFVDWSYHEKDPNAADWSCIAAPVHLQGDSLNNCSPSESAVASFTPQKSMHIQGTQTFRIGGGMLGGGGFKFHKPYSYTISPAIGGGSLVTVKIQFTGTAMQQPGNQEKMKALLVKAADVWTKQSPDGKTQFRFLSVGASDSPDFTVEVKKKKGDLYYRYWNVELLDEVFAPNTVAHELGHMMGLTDEYDPARSILFERKDNADTRQCNIRGFMCDTYAKNAYPYYYYLILRRGVCLSKAN